MDTKMERTNFTKNIYNMHKNLLKLSKFEEKEEKKSHAKLGQNYSKLVENVTISQRGPKRKDCQNFGQELVSVDSEVNNMV